MLRSLVATSRWVVKQRTPIGFAAQFQQPVANFHNFGVVYKSRNNGSKEQPRFRPETVRVCVLLR